MKFEEIKEKISSAKWKVNRRKSDLKDAELELAMAEDYLANMINKEKQ